MREKDRNRNQHELGLSVVSAMMSWTCGIRRAAGSMPVQGKVSDSRPIWDQKSPRIFQTTIEKREIFKCNFFDREQYLPLHSIKIHASADILKKYKEILKFQSYFLKTLYKYFSF